MIWFFPRKSQIKAWSCWFLTAKGLFMFSRAAGGSLLEVQTTEGKKGNVTLIQSSHTKCHLPTGLALHGELQIARSAARQKANLKTNAKKLPCFWAAGNYMLTQAWKESVQLTYGRGLRGTSFKAFWSFHWSLWDLESCVLSLAGFLSKVLRKSRQTWN